METRQLKWLFVAALFGVLITLEGARNFLEPYLEAWQGRLLLTGVTAMLIVSLFGAAFSMLSKAEERVTRKNRELLALHHAALDIYGELAVDTVLQKVVEQARSLLDARYGAISVIDEQGQILQFLTSGVSDEQKERIGEPPVGRGLLGVVLHEGARLRLDDVRHDPRSAGFPARHPDMKDLLAVPIVCKGPFRGNLYLANKTTARVFTVEDEDTLVRFATAAAIAIDNSYLHQQLEGFAIGRERARIGREIHDGMAQVLAYVNTKAQVVGQYLQRGRKDEAEQQLEQLSAAAREAYTDVREGIVSLRTEGLPDRPLAEVLREYYEQWQRRSGISGQFECDGDFRATPAVELQLLRVTQEALANVRKHSRAVRADLAVQRHDGNLVISVSDDGVGFNPEGPRRSELPRFGLTIMRERAESIGGTLELESKPNGGTAVRIEVPL